MKIIWYSEVAGAIFLLSSFTCCGGRGQDLAVHSAMHGEDERANEDWQTFQLVIRITIQDELKGDSPGGGFKSWGDHWANTIKNNREHGSPKKYVDFIISERRRVGLPELNI